MVLDELHEQAPDLLYSQGTYIVLEATLYMRNQLLRDADWTSMAHSIELRVPLVDIEVLASASRANKQNLAQAPTVPYLCHYHRQRQAFHSNARWALQSGPLKLSAVCVAGHGILQTATSTMA